MDWSVYTNAELLTVDTTSLSSDDLQTYREELNRRGLSTTPPPTLPGIPPNTSTSTSLVAPDGSGWVLGVDDDGALRTTQVI